MNMKTVWCTLFVSLVTCVAGLHAATYSVNFDGAGETKTSYTSGNVTLSGLSWQIGPQAVIGTDATGDMKNGARAARLRLNSSEYGSITMLADKTNGIGTVSFLYARSNFTNDRTGTAPSFVVEYSTNGGTSWTQVGSITSLAGIDSLTLFSETINQSGNVRIRIRQTAGATDKRWNVDDIVLTDYIPVTPLLTASPQTLNLATTLVNVASASTNFVLSGLNLTTNAITVTPSVGCEISTDNATFQTTALTFYGDTGTLNNTPIYARLIGTIPGTANGTISISGGGVSEPITVAITGYITDGKIVELLAGWNFYGTNSPASMVATFVQSNMDAGIAILTRGAEAPIWSAVNSFRTTGFKNLGIDVNSNRYFETTLRAANGKKLSIRSIHAVLDGTVSFATNAPAGVTSQFAYSLDGSAFTLIGSPQTIIGIPQTMTVTNIFSITALQNVPSTTTITLRYYASGQTTTGGWGFYSGSASANGLEISGVAEVDEAQNQPPTLTVTPQPSVLVAGAPVSFLVETADVENDTVSIAIQGISDYTFENNLLTWTPTAAGEQRVTFIVSEPLHPQNVMTQQISVAIGLAAPTHVETKATSNHSLLFFWQPVIGAEHYAVDLFTWSGSPISLLNEPLSACVPRGTSTATTNGVAGGTELDVGTLLPAWSGTKVYGALRTNLVEGLAVTNLLVKLGTTSALGWLQTPTFDLSRNHGAYTVSFDAGAWYTATESTNFLVIACDLLTQTATTNLVPLSKLEMTHVNLDLTGGTTHTAIRFEGLQDNDSRVFLDNISIVGSEGKQYIAQDVQVSSTTCLIQNQQIQSGAVYSGTITAVAGATESDVCSFDARAEIAPTLILLR